jgi:hypothetical protein
LWSVAGRQEVDSTFFIAQSHLRRLWTGGHVAFIKRAGIKEPSHVAPTDTGLGNRFHFQLTGWTLFNVSRYLLFFLGRKLITY